MLCAGRALWKSVMEIPGKEFILIHAISFRDGNPDPSVFQEWSTVLMTRILKFFLLQSINVGEKNYLNPAGHSLTFI